MHHTTDCLQVFKVLEGSLQGLQQPAELAVGRNVGHKTYLDVIAGCQDTLSNLNVGLLPHWIVLQEAVKSFLWSFSQHHQTCSKHCHHCQLRQLGSSPSPHG